MKHYPRHGLHQLERYRRVFPAVGIIGPAVVRKVPEGRELRVR